MDANTTVVIALIVLTFVVAIVIGVWQRSNARRAKQRHEHSSLDESPRPFPTRREPTPSSLAGEQTRPAAHHRTP
jgi:hypothetical protein